MDIMDMSLKIINMKIKQLDKHLMEKVEVITIKILELDGIILSSKVI